MGRNDIKQQSKWTIQKQKNSTRMNFLRKIKKNTLKKLWEAKKYIDR